MRKLKAAILLYVAFDLLIGGICGGFFQLSPAAAAQQGLLARSQVLNSQPAVSTQATVTAPAQSDNTRIIFDQVCFSAGATTAPVATQLTVNIRDGASGAGTVLTSFVVVVTATAGTHVAPTCVPLGFAGSPGTAATAEWSALLTNEFEQVSLFYHKAQ